MEVPKELLEATIAYLGTQRYQDVFQLINGFEAAFSADDFTSKQRPAVDETVMPEYEDPPTPA